MQRMGELVDGRRPLEKGLITWCRNLSVKWQHISSLIAALCFFFLRVINDYFVLCYWCKILLFML